MVIIHKVDVAKVNKTESSAVCYSIIAEARDPKCNPRSLVQFEPWKMTTFCDNEPSCGWRKWGGERRCVSTILLPQGNTLRCWSRQKKGYSEMQLVSMSSDMLERPAGLAGVVHQQQTQLWVRMSTGIRLGRPSSSSWKMWGRV